MSPEYKKKHLENLAVDLWRKFSDKEKNLVFLGMFPGWMMDQMPADPNDHHKVFCRIMDLSQKTWPLIYKDPA